MKVAVLTILKNEFLEFKRNNMYWECYHVVHVGQLEGVLFDLYVRLDGWKRLPVDVLNVVKAQEQIRGINKTKEVKATLQNRFNTFATGGFVPTSVKIQGKHLGVVHCNDPLPMHPNCGSVMIKPDDLPPQHHKTDMIDSISGLSAYTQKAIQAMSNFRIHLTSKDLPYLLNKDDIAGMP